MKESPSEVFGCSSFVYFKVIGTKKLFNSDNYTFLSYFVCEYVYLYHKNILVDFCITYFDSTQKIVYPKLKTFEMSGEKSNYYGFFSFKCPAAHRYRTKYISTDMFFNKFEISKINLNSTTQIHFDYLLTTISILILPNVADKYIEQNINYKIFNRELNKLAKIKRIIILLSIILIFIVIDLN